VTPVLDGRVVLHPGDCMEIMRSLPEASVDSVVTDPPYHLLSTVKRFAKSGGADRIHDGDNQYGRLSRGFMGKTWDGGDIAFRPETWAEVLRVLKPGGHLVAFGAPKNYHRLACAIEDAGFGIRDSLMWLFGSGFPKSHNLDGKHEGWGTALKPAYEPIILARKPLIGTVAANVLAHGTGAINVDACRVEGPGGVEREDEPSQDRRYTERGSTNFAATPGPRGGSPHGRWPANVVHDGSDEVLASFPETTSGKPGIMRGGVNTGAAYGAESRPPGTPMTGFGDSGSAARFFYCAKANAKDRAGSKHPTVKPIALMRWLVRMVTPPGGVVLDPFAGTGTTGRAAVEEGFDAILIEREPEYQADIARRMLFGGEDG